METWYEVQIRDMTDVYSTDASAEEYHITICTIEAEDAVGVDGNPTESVHFIGDDAFVVVKADRPIQALFRAIGHLTPDVRRKGDNV